MPNHVINRITLKGDKNEIQKVLDAVIKTDEEGKKYFDFESIIPMPENIYRGNLGMEERKKYGPNNWYDWSIANWGTKWSSYDNEVTDDYIQFSTAWSHPRPIVKASAEMFPLIDFIWEYADENTGYNTGSYKAENGKLYCHDIEDRSSEAYELYFELWGKSDCYFRDEDGNWQYYDCDDQCPNHDKC
ncbi:MAG: hypothetical protein PHE79_09610 [Eubacteriales bacterium]|nr:hypothetical protein [Eubacteriales bacterium]